MNSAGKGHLAGDAPGGRALAPLAPLFRDDGVRSKRRLIRPDGTHGCS